jgi:hypothetical protein
MADAFLELLPPLRCHHMGRAPSPGMAYRTLGQRSVHGADAQYQVQETARCTPPSSREKCSLAFILTTQQNDGDNRTTAYFGGSTPEAAT